MTDLYMTRAIELSRSGFPAPNPHVGCVLVKDGIVVGEGFHAYAGGPHAEAVALAQAGNLAEGADVYVTLEPCNHQGRTPPCAHALIQARVKQVFVANLDPNPVASGGGETLRNAGIPVSFGMLAAEAREANWQFSRSLELKRPVVIIKVAMGIDGRIAQPDGQSKWITGPRARLEAHRLRAEAGAVLVGYRTVLLDDPELTVREIETHNPPVRIVLDPKNRLKGSERVFNGAAPTLHLTGPIPSLEALVLKLAEHKITGILVEGGAGTITSFIEAGLADRYEIFIAPKFLGSGLTWINRSLFPDLASEPLKFHKVVSLGSDLQITAYAQAPS